MTEEAIFPLKVIQISSAGVPDFQMTAESIEEKALPDSLFKAPPEYKKFEIPGIPGSNGNFPGKMK